jgi:hypothetical protein
VVTKICAVCGKLFDTYLKRISSCSRACASAKTIQEKFWDHIEKTDSCWIWNGAKTPGGYGHFFHQGQWIYTHRYAYCHWKGCIPTGKVPDHLCYNRACVNPDHLEAVSERDNLLRGKHRVKMNGKYKSQRMCTFARTGTTMRTVAPAAI